MLCRSRYTSGALQVCSVARQRIALGAASPDAWLQPDELNPSEMAVVRVLVAQSCWRGPVNMEEKYRVLLNHMVL